MRWLWANLAVLISASACPGAGPAAQEAWRELFAQASPAEAAKHVRAVLAACENDAGKLKSLIASDTSYEQLKPGWHRQSKKVRDGKTEYEVEFLVRVPAGYTPKRSWPVLLAAHGQRGSGETIGWWIPRMLAGDLEKYILVCPTMPGPEVYNGRAYQEQAYLKPLAWARHRLNVDDDRVCVSGYSQGGHCAWHLATMYPRLFAAAVPMAGIPAFEGPIVVFDMYLENLRYVGVWAIWGEKDTAEPPRLGNADLCRAATKRLKQLGCEKYRGTELPGRGHGGSFPAPVEFAKFLGAHKRATVPEEFRYYFHLAHHARGYYVEATKFTRGPIEFGRPVRITVPPGEDPKKADPQEVIRKYVAARLFKIHATLDRAKNKLAIRTAGISRVRIYVTEGMFDLSRPVMLLALGRAWRGEVPVSAECMLNHYAATRDRTRLVCNEIDIPRSGKITVRYK